MSDRGYRIIDEPAPSALSRLAVNPFWIMLAGMLLSRWQAFAIIWFVVNSFALNSATKGKEICWAAGALVLALAGREPLQRLLDEQIGRAALIAWWPYVHIVVIAMLLTAMYRLYLYQFGSYQLFRYLKEGRA
ncbi:MAG: hypothetical protein ACREEV_05000 [Dongiaceae bacterium]